MRVGFPFPSLAGERLFLFGLQPLWHVRRIDLPPPPVFFRDRTLSLSPLPCVRCFVSSPFKFDREGFPLAREDNAAFCPPDPGGGRGTRVLERGVQSPPSFPGERLFSFPEGRCPPEKAPLCSSTSFLFFFYHAFFECCRNSPPVFPCLPARLDAFGA